MAAKTSVRWLWGTAVLVLGVAVILLYQHSLSALSPVPLILQPTLIANPPPVALAPALIDGDERVDLAGQAAHYVIRPRNEDPRLALDALLGGRGGPIADLDPISGVGEGRARDSTYLLFSYRTTTDDPIYLRYRSINPLLMSVWVSDRERSSYRLVDVAGADAPAYHPAADAADGTPLRILPYMTLPAGLSEERYVLVKVDSVFPVWSNFTLYARYTYAQLAAHRNYADGAFLGALVATMAFALYGLFFRQVFDYAVFLFAAATLTAWYLVYQEFSMAFDVAFLRRFAFVGPVCCYFLLHCFGVWRLLYPPGRLAHRYRRGPRVIPLALAAAFALLGIVHALVYAALGLDVPWPDSLGEMSKTVFVVIPPLLVLAVAIAPSRRIPGYLSLFVAESIGSAGLFLQWLHFSTGWFDSTFAEVLIQYSLPLEVLIWSYALSVRFNYLEMVAKGRVLAALHRETKRAKASVLAVVQSREAALDSLDRSYQSASQLQKNVLSMIATFRHSAKNLLARMGSQLCGPGSPCDDGSNKPSPSEQALNELVAVVDGFARAVSDAQNNAHASAAASHLLRWQIEAKRDELAKRGVNLLLDDQLVGDDLQVDGFHFMEAVREALSNVARYARSGTQVQIRLSVDAGELQLEIRNQATLRSDDWNLRHGWPVIPASFTENGETSHGLGLASLRSLLAQVDGAVRYHSEPPDVFVLTIQLPLRSRA